MKLKAIIVDDERLARKELRSLLAGFEEIAVAGEAENLSETVELIEAVRPDVVFLDIQLAHENGFELLERVENNFKLIFVTAFDEFAIRAFEINALDYLLKPVNPKRLATAVGRLFDDPEIKETESLRRLEIDDRLLLEIDDRSCFLKVAEISRIAAAGDYTEVFMTDGRYFLAEKPLREWEERLPEKFFARIHRSTVINLEEIDRIETLFNRTMEVSLKNCREKFPVSRRYAARLKEKFG
jgi:two-component system, LytTR family, response regulator